MSPNERFLAEFELYVMLAVAALPDGSYGALVRRAIEERTGRPVSIGAVYATLGRLEDKGFLKHRVAAPLPRPGGRSRKLYRLTPTGTRALRHSAAMLTRMMRGVDLLADGDAGR